MAGTWKDLTNQPTFNAGTMLLLTDGSVLCHDEPNTSTVSGSNRWYRLTPDAAGSYETGTWTRLANGPNSPLYFACSVLRDGRVFVVGGEYNGTSAQVELNAAEIYNPVSDSWTSIGTPAGWTQIGDAPSAVLPDGRVLLGDINGKRSAIYDPTANTWTAGPTKDDPRGTEETWALLPDGSILAIECDNRPKAEKYVPAANVWVSVGSTPVTLVDALSDEVGAAITVPDGRLFAIGATNHTALYTAPPIANQLGTWAAGPDFPVLVTGRVTGAKDAPACLLPNGRVLCVVAPCDQSAASNTSPFWGSPCHFFEYDPVANTLSEVTAPSNNGGNPYSSRLILLPTGQVLHTNGSSTVAIYTPDGAPDPTWRPSITSAPSVLHPGSTYTLQGRQLNGLSQAVIYGDEGAMATNYPLVRLTDPAGNVTYCRTHDHSTMAIQTGAVVHSTRFTVPSTIALGPVQLCVIANGISSSSCVSAAVTAKLWKELKWEIKELKENAKLEHERFKLVFEDLRKINEGDPLEWLEQLGWGEVIQRLVERSDELETEVRSMRSFVKAEERPEVAPQIGAMVKEIEPRREPEATEVPTPKPASYRKVRKATAKRSAGATKASTKKAGSAKKKAAGAASKATKRGSGTGRARGRR